MRTLVDVAQLPGQVELVADFVAGAVGHEDEPIEAFVLPRDAPSTRFIGIEYAARRIWAARPNFSSLGKEVVRR
jgi:hypothetical protein